MAKSSTVFLLALTLVSVGCASKKPPATTTTRTPIDPGVSTLRSLVPLPNHVGEGKGTFTVNADTVIYTPTGNEEVAWIGRYLSDVIGLAGGATAPRVEPAGDATPPNAIHLQIGAQRGEDDESYELIVSPERVTISAGKPAGLFYGVQTLRQLMPSFVEWEAIRFDKRRPLTIPVGHVNDRPRFAWRGAMLDVSRHFLTPVEVKRYIDLMSLYKLNRLHLHLSDDQGWRIEIKAWPNLTAHSGKTEVGGGTGGFYTQEEYADIVRYARQRFITIVPEIDMPGHTNAALSAYAELNCDGVAPPPYTDIRVGFSTLCVDKDITYKFIDDVVREIAAMTPGPYFHIGGDEVEKLTPQQYVSFVERVQGIVASHGKRVVGWDDIAPATLLANTYVQHWRPKSAPVEAVTKGAKVIMSVANRAYIDMKYDEATPIGLNWAGIVTVKNSYDWDPAAIAPGIPETAIAGVEAPLWAETLGNIRDYEFMAFPRLAAIAEVAWSTAGSRDWEAFRVRLGAHGPRWTALGVNFYRSPEIPWKD